MAGLRSTNELLDLLRKEATLPELQSLLRMVKGRPGAEETVIHRRTDHAHDELRSLMLRGVLTPEELVQAIQAAEENGNQHIFYYTPRGRSAARYLDDAAAIAAVLFQTADWQSSLGFPRISLIPSAGAVWADFRIGLPGKPRDWVAKLYVRDTRQEPVPHHERLAWEKRSGFQAPEGWTVSLTHQVPSRAVVTARWNHPDVFEIRVSRRGAVTAGTIPGRLFLMRKRLDEAFGNDTIIEWDLTPVRNNMILAEPNHREVYRTSQTRMSSRRGVTANFRQPTPEESLGSDDSAQDAIERLLRDGGQCHANTVKFLEEGSDGLLGDDLRVVVGATHRHEVVILSQASSTAVDYVTDQLRHHR